MMQLTLSQSKLAEISLALLQENLEEGGRLVLNPKEVKREIGNKAKKLGLKPAELAEVAQLMLQSAYERTIAELESMRDRTTEK